ncbi:hypothetical protein D1007_25103 [Hordeum vulgare]|nr:hypothetical protein D1007_25103 [Hordeum vulgare]
MCTGEVIVVPEGVDAQEGSDGVARVVSVDWNSVELNDPTDLVIAPMDGTEMAKKIGIPVADEDKEDNGESSEPFVVEDCWPKKKARSNGCRKKRSFGETMHIEPNLDGVVQNEQDLDVLLQNEQDLDVLVPSEDMGTSEDIPADVVPTKPILEVVLPTNDIGPDDTAALVVQNEGQAAVPGSLEKKTKSLGPMILQLLWCKMRVKLLFQAV